MIERAARACYASESGAVSSGDFVKRLISTGHHTPLEFGVIYLIVNKEDALKNKIVEFYEGNKFSTVVTRIVLADDGESKKVTDLFYVTTNYRVIIENNRQFDLQFMHEPNFNYHVPYAVFKVRTSIGVAREMNRYRLNSICERSTRYCNYSKDKFGNELTFMQKNWVTTLEPGKMNAKEQCFYDCCQLAEKNYMKMIEEGCTPQEARSVLPLATMTEVIYSGPLSSWKHFLDQRYHELTGKAHPECKKVAALINDYCLAIQEKMKQ